MIDVHAPEHGIQNVREFFLHLFTITVGLLIALGLEAGVEAIHHRNQRIEAETTIRQELTENRKILISAQPQLTAERNQLVGVLLLLQAKIKGDAVATKKGSLSFGEAPPQDAAWRTANATGVLNYMPYSQVQLYASAYKEQDLFDAMQRQTLDDYLQFDSYGAQGGFSKLSIDDLKSAVTLVRHAISHLDGELDVGAGLLGAYNNALKQ
ncbi:MAG: hypothetical protein WBY53_19245 [Acidobacteriaceae bacterium]